MNTMSLKRNCFALGALALCVNACGPGRQASWSQAKAAPQSPEAQAQRDVNHQELAQEAWTKRAERPELEKAISHWEQALAAHTDDAVVLPKLARAYYFLADAHIRLEDDAQKLLDTYEKGIQAGERAMMAASTQFADQVRAEIKVEDAVKLLGSGSEDAIYWYATNLGRFAVAKGFTTILFYKDRIYAVMQHLLALNEGYFYGAPHRYFGAFYAKAPAFAGGDMNKSKEHFDKALTIAPNYFGTKTLYAEYYAQKADERELFETLLKEVGAGDPTTLAGIEPEQAVEQKKAKDLLAQANEIF
jgi:tetratricopeptide (TPR) repeat protein